MKIKKNKPPKLFLRFFRWFCHPDLHLFVEGDLLELYEERLKNSGKRKADLRFVIDVLLLFRPSIIRPTEGFRILNNYAMFRNYLKVGIRNLLKYKTFSFINIFGLAIAMSVCMLIILMLADQNSYDQFHEKKDRTYRILSKRAGSVTANASSPFPLASALLENYPITEESTNLAIGVGGEASFNGKTTELRGFFADSSFFKVFSFDLKSGNKSTALLAPNSMILTKKMAHKIFGSEDPIGKTIEFVDRGLHFLQMDIGGERNSPPVDWGSYTITGIIADESYKSHLKFDVLVSATSMQSLSLSDKINNLDDNWQIYSRTFTYVVLKPGRTERDLTLALNDIVARKYADIENLKGFQLIGQSLNSITPGIFVGNPISLRLPVEAYYFLGFIALVVMLSACLNYTNLSTARALTRAKEIGVRKVAGAKRKSLIYQFLSESILIAFFALAMAGILLILVKYAFMDLWVNQLLNFNLEGNLSVVFIFLGFAFIIGVISGVYPALHLSNYKPIKALRHLENARLGKLGIRKMLSISQFAISLFFIVTSILIYRQFKHFLQFEYGFDTRNIVNVSLQSNDYGHIANEFVKVPGVDLISGCELIPATGNSNAIGVRKSGDEEDFTEFEYLPANENFLLNLNVELIAGRNLPVDGQLSDRHVLVNEAAVKLLGFNHPNEVLGQLLETGDQSSMEIIGVVNDFRYQMPMLKDEIGPLLLRNQPHLFNYLNVKITSNNPMSTITKLEDTWNRLDPIHSFEYQFFDDQLVQANMVFGDLVSILGYIAFLAVTIACLGLLGMATYAKERRMKEVGIRKVLGAGDLKIAFLLSKSFLVMLIISILISSPLTYVTNNLWLRNFPNRVDFGFGTILFGSLVLLVLGLITIGSQTFIASRSKPVDSLRMD